MNNDSANPDPENQPGQPQPEPQPSKPAATETAETAQTPTQRKSSPSIQIGSQRDAADPALKPSQPKAVQQAKANPVEIVEAAAPVKQEEPAQIHSAEGFSEDIESEIEAAIGGISMDAVMGGFAEGEEELELNSRVKATVSKTHGGDVFVSLKGRFEGVVSMAQFKTPPSDGQMIEVIVKNRNDDDGLYEVAIPGAAINVADWEDINVGDIVEARISGSNTGGLEAMINSLCVFIPASQISRFRVEDFGEYVNQKLPCLVTEVNPAKRKLVLSHRAILERENEEKRKELLTTIAVGNQYDGTVTKLMDFGAFVDIGGVEGLVHISKLSWDRVTHPKEVVSEGEKVKVQVDQVNQETGKIGLSIRDTMEHPWDGIQSKYALGDIVKGTVTRNTDFGAFVKLEPGIEGLVHISEIAHHRVVKVGNHVNRGDQVEVKILSIDPDKQKLGLSIKATHAAPVKAKDVKVEEVDEPIRESAVPRFDAPLKGGTDRKSGGEGVGLNW